MNRRLETLLALILILLGIGVRIYFLIHWENIFSVEVESYSKLQIMLQWDQSPLLYPDINFGPLHMVLLQWPWKLTGSLVTANRLVSLAFGIGLLFLVFGITRRIFGPAAALGSLAFASLSFLPIKTSIVTLAEGPTAFFTLLGLYLLTIATEKAKGSWAFLFGAACSFSAMSALRFETWVFLPILTLWMWKKRGLAHAFLFGSLLALFPIIHMGISWMKVGDPLNFLHVSAAITAANSAKVPIAQRALGFLTSLGFTCTWLVVALVFVAPVFLFNGKRSGGKLIGTLLIVILGLYEYKAVQATLAPELYRYLTIPCSLILLVWVVPVAELGRWLWRKNGAAVAMLTCLVGLVSGAWSVHSMVRDAVSLESAQSAVRTVRNIKKGLNDGDRIFIGSEYHPLIVVESGLHWENFRQPALHLSPEEMEESTRRVFEEYRPNVVVIYAKDWFFVDVLKINPLCAERLTLFERNFRRQGQENDWCWYRSWENPSN